LKNSSVKIRLSSLEADFVFARSVCGPSLPFAAAVPASPRPPGGQKANGVSFCLLVQSRGSHRAPATGALEHRLKHEIPTAH